MGYGSSSGRGLGLALFSFTPSLVAMKRSVFAIVLAYSLAGLASADEAIRRGEVEFQPTKNEPSVPERFRLAAHRFAFEERPQETSATKIRISEVTFPSPVVTPHAANNTVHCEYF